MALSILDGNQSATTLSTILTSGQHITAHTVVSLGTQAITDMRGAVSGSVVSISNFPSTQPVSIASVTIGSLPAISGTVTANVIGTRTFVDGNTVTVSGFLSVGGWDAVNSQHAPIPLTDGGFGVRVGFDDTTGAPFQVTNHPSVPLSATVTVGNSVTIGSLPAISGTVTANLGNVAQSMPLGVTVTIPSSAVRIGWADEEQFYGVGTDSYGSPLPIQILLGNSIGDRVTTENPLPISGTVTVGAVSTTVTIAHHQGTSVTTSNFTSTTASTTLASANASREVLTIFNEGAGNLHICAGATCTTIAYQVRLSAGDYYEVPLNQTSLTHSAVFATAGTARVTEIS